MSMNRFMHPRNPYKNPPDYTQLAIKYPEFRKVCRLELDGTVSIDMKSENTLKSLTKSLLSRDFDLNIDIPQDHLVPTVPLRLNYILWLEDIMKLLQISDRPISGIDIGCGASCIYSLLAARKNGWQMTALELNPTNLHYARENIKRNDLTNLVRVFEQTDSNVIFRDYLATVDASSQHFDFCLCNPPFFEADGHKQPPTVLTSPSGDKNTENRKPAANESTGVRDETSCEGGEVAFVRRILEESFLFKDRIRVYTTMLGQKTSSISILKLLKENQITNFAQTEFCQGNTTRWGLAWTFDSNLILRSVPSQTAGLLHKSTKSFTYAFRTAETFVECTTYLNGIFSDIRLNLERTSSSLLSLSDTGTTTGYTESAEAPSLSFLAKAYADHWTNIRRKRRCGESTKDIAEAVAGGQEGECSTAAGDVTAPILTFEIVMNYDCTDKTFTLRLVYLDGHAGVDGLYRLFQFLKNSVKSLEEKE